MNKFGDLIRSKREEQEIKTKLDNEKQFLTNLHKMVREHGELTNDPEKLFKAFNQEDLKSNFGIVQRTPEIAKEII